MRKKDLGGGGGAGGGTSVGSGPAAAAAARTCKTRSSSSPARYNIIHQERCTRVSLRAAIPLQSAVINIYRVYRLHDRLVGITSCTLSAYREGAHRSYTRSPKTRSICTRGFARVATRRPSFS